MMRKLITSLTATSLAALTVLATAAPADAARLFTPDEKGDVWTRGTDDVFSEVGTRANVDVVGSAVRHAEHRVHASARYDDLVANSDRFVLPVHLNASNGNTYTLRVVAAPGDRDGTVTLLRYNIETGDRGRVPCAGLRLSIDYQDDLIGVSAPRSCLGRPVWVEYGGVARAVDTTGKVFTDALLSGDPVNDLYSDRIRRG